MTITPKNAAALLTTSLTTVYTCPSGASAIVIGSQIANIGSSNTTATVAWTDSSAAATYYLVSGAKVPANNAIVPVEKRHTLEAGDSIKALAGAAGALHISLSILEINA
jgi:hypothetical protein